MLCAMRRHVQGRTLVRMDILRAQGLLSAWKHFSTRSESWYYVALADDIVHNADTFVLKTLDDVIVADAVVVVVVPSQLIVFRQKYFRQMR